MFDFTLFALLVFISLPGIYLATKGQISMLRSMLGSADVNESTLAAISFVQSLVIVGIAAAVGTALAPVLGLQTPIYSAAVEGTSVSVVITAFLWPMIALTGAMTAIFLAAYYGWIRPRLGQETIRIVERVRLEMGLLGRLLYGGIVEEILSRWGLMSLVVWLGTLLMGRASAGVVWLSIVVAGTLFALGHLPGLVAAGAPRTRLLTAAVLLTNLWLSLAFGWLFWRYGLAAAIGSHMIVHLLWYPIDRWHLRLEGKSQLIVQDRLEGGEQ